MNRAKHLARDQRYSLSGIAFAAGVPPYVARRLLKSTGRIGSRRAKRVRLMPSEHEAVVATLKRLR